MSRTIIGIMGPGKATKQECEHARSLGQLVAQEGWVLLTGGRDKGIMDAASSGASGAGGLVIGVLPGSERSGASRFVDIPICTGMGSARNAINILSSDIVIACGSGAGTTSEIMLALKSEKPLILYSPSQNLVDFITELPYPNPRLIHSPEELIPAITPYL